MVSKSIVGVRFTRSKRHSICYIDNFSIELQEIIRKHLSRVCYGAPKATSKRKSYNYQNTLKEFLKRYESKTKELRIGMIGEMITHILVLEFFPEFFTVSPYFNLEERSIKKGFDLMLVTNHDRQIWVTEVKSGELHKNRDTNETNRTLLGVAKRDLKKRLNEKETTFWENAINGAHIALANNHDAKNAVIDILSDIEDDIYDEYAISNDKNVVLVSSVFSDLSDRIDNDNIKIQLDKIIKEEIFKDVMILSIQKETYQKIYSFLKTEARK